MAGTTAALNLSQQDLRVTVVDPRPRCPQVFKSEKIEPEQVESLRKFGLLERLLPHANRIREIRSFYQGKLLGITATEQYGIRYNVLVNTLRASLGGNAQFKLGRVIQITPSDDLQQVIFETGEQLTCRLVVLACGLNGDLLGNLRLKRTWIQKHQSIAVAWTFAARDSAGFSVDAVTYALNDTRTGTDYLSMFPMENMLRANLFAFPAEDSSWVQRLVRDPNAELPRLIPQLERAIGDYRVTGKVETSLIHLYRTDGHLPPGVVLIGDACQNVCPSTGIGLSKIFTDVDVLCSHCVPGWFQSSGMDSEKLMNFAGNPRKLATDTQALENAFYRRHACTARSRKWKIHRARLHLSRQLEWLASWHRRGLQGSSVRPSFRD